MLTSRELILLQFARFGALSNAQLKELCTPYMGEAMMYRSLSKLVSGGYVQKQSFLGHKRFVNCVREKGFKLIFSSPEYNFVPLREVDFRHTMSVTDALTILSKYSKVTGLSTEREYPVGGTRTFCFMRIPDAILRLEGPNGPFEAAIEVETSRKSDERMRALIGNYRLTFEKEMPCRALFLFCRTQDIVDAYKKLKAELPEEISKGILIRDFKQLPFLPKTFGEFRQGSKGCVELTASNYTGGRVFAPMKSIDWNFETA